MEDEEEFGLGIAGFQKSVPKTLELCVRVIRIYVMVVTNNERQKVSQHAQQFRISSPFSSWDILDW